MYKGKAFSPFTTLANAIGGADTVIEVNDISVFPPAPNIATIGADDNAETIRYAAIAGNLLSGCARGVEGVPRQWDSGTMIGRNFTNLDYESIVANVENSVQRKIGNSSDILFEDGDTFQEKFDGGELVGPPGADGPPGRGIFTFDRQDGNLYFIAETGIENPFEYDEQTGNLYYKVG